MRVGRILGFYLVCMALIFVASTFSVFAFPASSRTIYYASLWADLGVSMLFLIILMLRIR